MLSLLFIFLAGLCNSVMDVLLFRFDSSIFSKFNKDSWFNPILSWKNKWNNGDSTQGEKFIGSSTLFVALTDGWHFFKLLMILLICASVTFYEPIVNKYIDIVLLYLTFTITFELFYSKFLIKKIK